MNLEFEWALRVWRSLFKKNLEYFTHFEIYNREPRRDCNWFFEHVFLCCHCAIKSLISLNFELGIDKVKLEVSTKMPRHMTFVEGVTVLW